MAIINSNQSSSLFPIHRKTLNEYLEGPLVYEKELGRGSGGIVWKAVAPHFGKPFVFKDLITPFTTAEHLDPETITADSKEICGELEALKFNHTPGLSHTLAAVIRIGGNPQTDHVIETYEELQEEIKELTSDFSKKVVPLQNELDRLKAEGDIQNAIPQLEKQIREAYTLHRCIIIASIQEFLDGKDLYDTIEDEITKNELLPNPPLLIGLPVAKAKAFAIQFLEALDSIHQEGRIHRDLKPENIFVLRDGRIVIIDFGFTENLGVHAAPKQHLEFYGTPAYCAPEVLSNRPYNEMADVFAAGIILFRAVTARDALINPDNENQLDPRFVAKVKAYGQENGSLESHPDSKKHIEAIAKIDPAYAQAIVSLSRGNPNDRMTIRQAIDLLKK